MKTLIQLGPKDHGRELGDDEWEGAQLAEGHEPALPGLAVTLTGE